MKELEVLQKRPKEPVKEIVSLDMKKLSPISQDGAALLR
jgi:hypothetical protein